MEAQRLKCDSLTHKTKLKTQNSNPILLTLNSQLSYNHHRIPITEKPVFINYGNFIGIHNIIITGKG